MNNAKTNIKDRLAIIITHPIQYNAPLFQMMSLRNRLQIKVFYTWEQTEKGNKYDPGFRKKIEWDIPLLEGYEYTFVKNISKKPGSDHYYGIINPTLINEIKQWKPNCLLVFGWNFKSHLKAIIYFYKKIPIIFRGDSNLLDERPGYNLLMRRIFLKWLYKHIDYVLYTGSNNRDYFLKHGVKENQLIFGPHAVDNNRFIDKNNFYRSRAMQWRNELGILPSDIVLLFAGKLEPKKNIELLINAFLEIQKPDLHLIVVGNGILEQKLKTLAAHSKNIHFIEFQNQLKMPVIYNLCDLYILPSKGPGETWGLSVNEAMACSKAVIVSNKSGCAIDLVKNDENGFIFNHLEKMDLIDKINRVISDPQKLELMGLKSLSIINNWTYEIICRNLEQLIENITAN